MALVISGFSRIFACSADTRSLIPPPAQAALPANITPTNIKAVSMKHSLLLRDIDSALPGDTKIIYLRAAAINKTSVRVGRGCRHPQVIRLPIAAKRCKFLESEEEL